MKPALVLASGSPRRRELLAGLGLRFAVRPPEVDETPRSGEAPEAFVLRLAREKAGADSGGRAAPEREIVLAADTVVVVDGELLGKPRDAADAARMLRRIAGREHQVLTGVAVREAWSERVAADVERTQVRIAALSEPRIAWYVATGEPLDKAGAYAVQGLGALLVEAVFGNYTNVVGLPLPLVARLFADLGYDLIDFR
ncbi:MAG TPA: Maf family protein [Thermoanaerobaculia bacterium]|nr:Maf family protein [Thermoanaerobaculia bacterium]